MILDGIIEVLIGVDFAPPLSLTFAAGIPGFIMLLISFWYQRKASDLESEERPDWNRQIESSVPLETRARDRILNILRYGGVYLLSMFFFFGGGGILTGMFMFVFLGLLFRLFEEPIEYQGWRQRENSHKD